jgi:hypothetical protein
MRALPAAKVRFEMLDLASLASVRAFAEQMLGATSPQAEPMGYYGPKGVYELTGPVAPAYVAPKAKDEALARKLWELSEKLTGVQWPIEEQSRAYFPKIAHKPWEEVHTLFPS